MYMYDTLVCQEDALKRSRTRLRDFKDQAHNADKVLRQHRAAREKAEKKKEELRTVAMQYDIEKKDQIY